MRKTLYLWESWSSKPITKPSMKIASNRFPKGNSYKIPNWGSSKLSSSSKQGKSEKLKLVRKYTCGGGKKILQELKELDRAKE